MNSHQWSPYNQQSYLNSGSPHLPHSVHREDTINNYGGANSSSQLLPSCQGMPPLSARTNAEAPPPTSLLPNSNYNSLVSPSMQPCKEYDGYHENNMYNNGICKENQYGLRNYMQTRGSMSRNEGNVYFGPEKNPGYPGQVPSISFNGSSNLNPSPGPFGVLPHETVSPHRTCYDRSKEKFIPPGSKNNTIPYNNTTYNERDANNVFSPAPLSVQSTYSGDTSSLSPIVESVTSPKFSSPSEYYSSPKTNFGAYSSLQSPVPQSPSVAQPSYPSSPYTNIESVNHISAPPCSPMSGGPYGSGMNRVPVRNGIKTEHSPNSAPSNVLCYNSQSPSMGYHGPPSVMSEPPDYCSEYNMYPPEQNSSPYSPVCSTLHHGQIPSRMSSRNRTHPNIHYGHSVPSAMSSSSFIQNNINHKAAYSACSSNIPSGQQMHSSRYMPCSSSMNTATNNALQPTSVPKPNLNERNYVFETNIVHDKGALDLFNCHVDSGQNQEAAKSMNFLDNDLRMLGNNTMSNNRSLRAKYDSHSNQYANSENMKRNMYSGIPEHMNEKFPYVEEKNPYNSSFEHNGYEKYANNFPRRRGRRGRRRIGLQRGSRGRGYQSFKYDTNNNNSLPSYSNHDCYQFESRTENHMTAPTPVSFIREECQLCFCQRTTGNPVNKNCCDNRMLNQYIVYLIKVFFKPTQCKRRTRNTIRKDSDYQKNYLSYINTKELSSVCSSTVFRRVRKLRSFLTEKVHETLKLKVKKNPNEPNSWYCIGRTSPVEIPSSPDDNLSCDDSGLSNKLVPQKNDSVEESNHLKGKASSSISSTKKKSSASAFDKQLAPEASLTNFTTFPLGMPSIKKEVESPVCSEDELPIKPKRGRRKKQVQTTTSETKRRGRKPSVKPSQAQQKDASVTIKTKPPDVDEAASERLRSLRSRGETLKVEELELGTTIKEEPIDYSSDHCEDLLDDSDSDPMWIPGSKPTKPAENPVVVTGRKRGPKPGCRPSKGGVSTKKRKIKSEDISEKSKKKQSEKSQPSNDLCKPTSITKVKKEKEPISDKFLIAKADINLPTPFIWKVDRKSSMLQRFEISEQNGVLLYHSSFTFAAGNEISVNKYVTADVIVKSPDVVQYLGPNFSEAAEIALSKMQPKVKKPEPQTSVKPPLETFDHLKEDFAIYIQSLLSQDVDSSFFDEIIKYNDDYFLTPIKNIDSVSEKKKKVVISGFKDEELKSSIDVFPTVNIISRIDDSINCQVCTTNRTAHLLQFYGEPYDEIKLCSVETVSTLKTNFNVCDTCSTSVSLYNRLHHHKYNLFMKCRSKACEVKNSNGGVQSHEDVLKQCLEDTTWIDFMFEKQVQLWRECEKVR